MQNVHGGNTNTTSYIVNIAGTTAGDLVVVTLGWDPDSVNVLSIVDSAGNPYIQASSARTGHAFIQSSDIWYSKNVLGGATTVTITMDSTYVHFVASVYEFAGASITAPFSSANNAQIFSPTTISPAVTPPVVGNVVVALGFNDNFLYTGATAPFIGVADSTVTGFASAYQIGAPVSAQQCTFTPTNGGNVDWASSAAVFTVASAAPTGNGQMFLVF
jgi:hypothetical protein